MRCSAEGMISVGRCDREGVPVPDLDGRVLCWQHRRIAFGLNWRPQPIEERSFEGTWRKYMEGVC